MSEFFFFSAPTANLLSHYLATLRNHLACPERSLLDLSQILYSREVENWVAVVRSRSRMELLRRVDTLLDSLREPSPDWNLIGKSCLLGRSVEPVPKKVDEDFRVAMEAWLREPKGSSQTQLPAVPFEELSFLHPNSKTAASRENFALLEFLREKLDLEDRVSVHQSVKAEAAEKLTLKSNEESTLLILAEQLLLQQNLKGESEFTLSLEQNPYLEDHALQNRLILPLASALEMMTQCLPFPLVLKNIHVRRGVMVKGATKLRVQRDGNLLKLLEIRPTGREVLAYEAEIGDDVPQPPACTEHFPLGQPSSGLETFYRDLTFYGPKFFGIQHIFGIDGDSLQGRVVGSCPSQWNREESRVGWRFDPLIFDSAFQMTMLWSILEAGKGLLPDSIDELVLLKPFGLRSVNLDITLDKADEKGVTGTLIFSCDGEQRAWIRGGRGKFVSMETIRPDD